MNVSSLLLCDFAQIREGLLFVVSGGVSRVYRSGVPARLGLHLAMVVDMTAEEAGAAHDLAVQVVDRTGTEVAAVSATFKVGDVVVVCGTPEAVEHAETLLLMG